jgi:hypothetical protein
VTAVDRDVGKHAKIFYHIISGNENGSFSLDRTTGSIYTNTSFDHEEKNEYNLLIKATNDPQYYVSEVNTVWLPFMHSANSTLCYDKKY